jgi:hypothetical protein
MPYRKTNTLLDANKEVGLEMIPEKMKCMLVISSEGWSKA